MEKDGGIEQLLNKMIARYNHLYSNVPWDSIFSSPDIQLNNENTAILDHSHEKLSLWHTFFEKIHSVMGLTWLSVIEPLVEKAVNEYRLPYPEIFQAKLVQTRLEAREVSQENLKLKSLNERLEKHLDQVQRKMTEDENTGLKNQRFFTYYLSEELQDGSFLESDSEFLFIGLDNLQAINLSFGKDGGDRALSSLAYIIDETLTKKTTALTRQVFKLDGPRFLCYMPEEPRSTAKEEAKKLLQDVADSDAFFTDITVSIGIVSGSEIFRMNKKPGDMIEELLRTGGDRLTEAQKNGGNSIYFPSGERDIKPGRHKICIIDTDSYFTEVLASELAKMDINVILYTDGEEALTNIPAQQPDCIISEFTVPIVSGIEILEQLRADPVTARIPFILASYKKNDTLIEKAYSLRVRNFLKKPVSLQEVTSIVRTIIEA
ncbi:MAG: response regulator [Spirochaetia bacterium]